METIYVLILGLLAGLLIFVFAHLRPLDDNEIGKLGNKRRKRYIRKYFTFFVGTYSVNNEFKRCMNPDGSFYKFNEKLENFPAIAAALLKYKKHEWIIVAFEKSKLIGTIWFNKGPNNSSVSLHLPLESVVNVAKKDGYSSVLIFHNHPNSNPNVFNCTQPSNQDIVSAKVFAERLNNHGINLLEFVCERGVSYEFYLSPSDCFYPLADIIEGIVRQNGVSKLRNLGLHIERFF